MKGDMPAVAFRLREELGARTVRLSVEPIGQGRPVGSGEGKGKGKRSSKRKIVRIGNKVYDSINHVCRARSISSTTVHRWVKEGKAHLSKPPA